MTDLIACLVKLIIVNVELLSPKRLLPYQCVCVCRLVGSGFLHSKPDKLSDKYCVHMHVEMYNVQFQKVSINPPQERSLEIPRGRGVSKVTIFKGKYEAKLEFPGRRG